MISSTIYKWLVLCLLFGFAVLLIWRPLEAEDDIWAHAAIGSWIWDHMAVPHETLFLWHPPIPWVYHPWLTQLLFYGLASLPNEQVTIMTFTVVVGLIPLVIVAWVWT